jgi:1-aminocyclopropane-1-carboxylate deaminase/D-cysteine desulfhydrase-like pyridoxal-dependent ACC family enzyme
MAGVNEHPLFTAFPFLSGKLARVPLGNFPTKVERLANMERRLGLGSLWIKRDDLSGELHGGNKVRKLEYLLAGPAGRGGVRAVAYGPLSSNWTLAFSIYARRLGIPFDLHLFAMRGRAVKEEQVLFQRELARSCFEYSSALSFFPHLLASSLSRRGGRSITMPPGGTSSRSIMGYVNAFFELIIQVRDGLLPMPDVIVLPMGTGGTAAGLALGAALAGARTEILGVRVAPRILSNGFLARRLAARALRSLGREVALRPEAAGALLSIEHRFFGKGYGIPTPEGLEAARVLEAEEGIRLDHTYTAKAFACLLERARQGWGRGKHVLYWHTLNAVPLERTRELLGLPAARAT